MIHSFKFLTSELISAFEVKDIKVVILLTVVPYWNSKESSHSTEIQQQNKQRKQY